MVAVALVLVLWAAAPTDLAVQKLTMKGPQLPGIGDGDFIQRCVDTHNRYRSAVTPSASDMLYMTWDDALAKTAAVWARNCRFSHNPQLKIPFKLHHGFPTLGENIWVATSYTIFTVERAIKEWNDEVTFYKYHENSCSNVCGHYTQIVWAKSYKVGCAVQICSRGVSGFSNEPTAAIFVCNYGDAGNLRGVRPYQAGTPCSKCNGTQCQLNMCSDPQRDGVKSNQFWVSVLVIRPVLLLLTLLGAFGVQQIYPTIFAYE